VPYTLYYDSNHCWRRGFSVIILTSYEPISTKLFRPSWTFIRGCKKMKSSVCVPYHYCRLYILWHFHYWFSFLLSLWHWYLWQGIERYLSFLKGTDKLPVCETLGINTCSHHALVLTVFHLLMRCRCTKKLKLYHVDCPSSKVYFLVLFLKFMSNSVFIQ
jgi:hypothetical protein